MDHGRRKTAPGQPSRSVNNIFVFSAVFTCPSENFTEIDMICKMKGTLSTFNVLAKQKHFSFALH